MLRAGLSGVVMGLLIALLGLCPFFIPGLSIVDPTTDLILLGVLFLLGLMLGLVTMSFGLVMAGTGLDRNHFLSYKQRS